MQREVPRVGVARGVDVDLVERDHVAPEHHRLQVEAAAVGQHARDAGEEVAVDRPPGARPRCSSGEQKCSKAPRLATASKRAEGRRGSTCRASWRWTSRPCRRQAAACAEDSVTPTPVAAPAADEVEQRAPAAAQVEHAPARPDPDLLGHVLVLAPLRLLEGQREVAVVLGSAEVGELSQAEPEDAVDQRVGELEVARGRPWT